MAQNLITGAIGSILAGGDIVISNARYIAILNTSTTDTINISQAGRGDFDLPAGLSYTFPYDANRYYPVTTITAGTGEFVYDWQP